MLHHKIYTPECCLNDGTYLPIKTSLILKTTLTIRSQHRYIA